MQVSDLTVFATGLITLYSPAATIGPVAALIAPYDASTRRLIALRVAGAYLLVEIVALWFGREVMRGLGISIPALTVAGGVALFVAALPMMLRGHAEGGESASVFAAQAEAAAPGGTDWRRIVVVPLTFPLQMGGATVATVISMGGRFDSPKELAAISAVCLGMAVVVLVTTTVAGPLSRLLGRGGMDILTRVTGIILVAVSAQLLVSGVVGLVRIA